MHEDKQLQEKSQLNGAVPSQTRNEPSKFARDVVWIAMSQVFATLLGIVALPALTKTYNSEMYGIWTQIFVTVGLVSPILALEFVTAVVRYLAGEDNQAKRLHSLGTMLCAIIIVISVVLIITNILASPISFLLFGKPIYGIFVRLAILWASADALFAFFIAYMRARGKIKRLSIIQSIFSITKMVSLLVLALSAISLEWVVATMVFIEIVFTFSILCIIVREEGFLVPNLVGIKKFLMFSVPQVPSGILGWIITSSDRIFITHFLGLSQTGIYASSNSIGAFVGLLSYPIGFVLLPTVSKAWEQKRREDVKDYFEYATKLFLTLAIPVACGLAMLSQPILKILTTQEYMAGWLLVLLVAIGMIFNGLFLINDYVIYLLQQTKWEAIMMVIATIVSLTLNYILIPQIGIIGAAISHIVSNFILAAIVTIWAKKSFKYNIDSRYLVKVLIAAIIMGLYLYLVKVDSILGIILNVVVGTFIFGIILLLLRAFSERDRRLIKQVLGGMIPRIH